MRVLALSVASVLSLVVAVTAACAQPPAACSQDVDKLCKGITPGGGRLLACLKSHEGDVSKECKQALAHARQALAQSHSALAKTLSACEGDRQAHCKDVAPGGGRIIACLKKNEAALSDACKAALNEKQAP